MAMLPNIWQHFCKSKRCLIALPNSVAFDWRSWKKIYVFHYVVALIIGIYDNTSSWNLLLFGIFFRSLSWQKWKPQRQVCKVIKHISYIQCIRQTNAVCSGHLIEFRPYVLVKVSPCKIFYWVQQLIIACKIELFQISWSRTLRLQYSLIR